jgi:hypothetical protein
MYGKERRYLQLTMSGQVPIWYQKVKAPAISFAIPLTTTLGHTPER